MFTPLTAQEKLTRHVERMDASVYGPDLPILQPGWSALHLLNLESLAESFLNDNDYRDTARQGKVKPIHTTGISAPVDFVVTVTLGIPACISLVA